MNILIIYLLKSYYVLSLVLLKIFDHIFILKCVSEFLIVSPHSDPGDDGYLFESMIFFSDNVLHSLHHPSSESHMLSRSIWGNSDAELIAKYMYFTNNRRSIEYSEEVLFSREVL